MDRIDAMLKKNIKIPGFFKELAEELADLAVNQIPDKAREEHHQHRYFDRLEKAYETVIRSTIWFKFWQKCNWLTYPTKKDLAYLPYVSDFELSPI